MKHDPLVLRFDKLIKQTHVKVLSKVVTAKSFSASIPPMLICIRITPLYIDDAILKITLRLISMCRPPVGTLILSKKELLLRVLMTKVYEFLSLGLVESDLKYFHYSPFPTYWIHRAYLEVFFPPLCTLLKPKGHDDVTGDNRTTESSVLIILR